MSPDKNKPMEGDQRKQQRFTKRRERVHSKLVDPDGAKDEMDSSPSRSDGDKPRAKPPRRRRNRSHSHDEDIIDGFAILSFKSLEDLVSFFLPICTQLLSIHHKYVLLSRSLSLRLKCGFEFVLDLSFSCALVNGQMRME